MYVCVVLEVAKERGDSARTEGADECELPCGCQEPNLDPLWEQQVLP